MTQHVSRKHGRNVRADGKADKPKNESGIRLRKWKGANGQVRTAYQADAGMINGKRLMRSFETKDGAKTWLHAKTLELKNQGHPAMALTDRQPGKK